MTNEELMQIMTDFGLHEGGMENWVKDNAWLRVANEVQAREREACAKLCDERGQGRYALEHYAALTYVGATHDCAVAIRARGEMK